MADVWPFQPQTQLREQMEWTTEVIRCRSAEQRICLRNTPRTTIKYDFVLFAQEIEAAAILSRQWSSNEFLLPFWQDFEYSGTIASGATIIYVSSTANKRYNVGEYLFIIETNNQQYEIAIINDVNSSYIEIESPITLSFDQAVVMPCYPCYMKAPFQFQKYSAKYFTANAEFILTDDLQVGTNNNYPVFQDSYVLNDRPIVFGKINESHIREFEGFKNIAGPIFYSELYTYPVSNTAVSWSFHEKAGLWNFRQWMHYVKGKQGSFYIPRWTRDFVPVVNINSSDNFIIVKENSYYIDSYIGNACLIKNDGTQIYFTVVSWQFFATNQYKMNTSQVIGENIQIVDIEIITRMPRMRLDSDVIEYNYKDSGTVDVKLPLMEVLS